MDTHDSPKQDKQVTVAVPEDRVPEFYAFYGRFLAHAGRGRRRGPHGRGRCGHRTEEHAAEKQPRPVAEA